MIHILVAGAGRVGLLAASMLASSGKYHVHLGDLNQPDILPDLGDKQSQLTTIKLNIANSDEAEIYIQKNDIKAIVAALPYSLTRKVAEIASATNCHYFDLTEDVATTEFVKQLAKDSQYCFAPQCGLAPGFISVVANDLMRQFDDIDTVKMRVGALPVNTSNALKYALTWSTEGLVNEYVKPCISIENHEITTVKPLADLETITLNGNQYEAFNTSGGIGSLKESYEGKVKSMSYKTIRYPGHRDRLHFLIEDLKLKDNPELLCEILEGALPRVDDDVVIVYVSAEGYIKGEYCERHFAHKFYAERHFAHQWTALQLTTASGLCVTVDLALSQDHFKPGFVKQEMIDLDTMINNEFGHYYKNSMHRNDQSPKTVATKEFEEDILVI
ncbi:MAG: saccharopine dehydrogenase C-terminal domain-containing protein [Francisellaceae bacterium]